ncbi:MAG: polymer-forming cytoskeletal protein [Acidimicrobiia bacterium]|nr:polymer-forming cytoskeletal protein [Acidimicrobiia bacterium]
MKRAVLALSVGLLAIPLIARAETTQSDFVLVRDGEVVTEDLIAAGNSVQVDGTIQGDLVASAFDRIVINGEVTGDVLALSGRVEINGTVGGSVRAAAGTVLVNGEVEDDVVVTAWTTTIGASAAIGRDLIVFGRHGVVAGEVNRDITGRFTSLSLNAIVDGSVEVSVGRFTVGSGAQVSGDIGYRSEREAVIEAANPGGEIIHRTPLRPNIRVTALLFLTYGLFGLLLLAGGLAASHYWPDRLERAVRAARRPVPTWLAGVGVAFSPLLMMGLFGGFLSFSPAAAAIPLAVVFLPLAFGLAGLVFVGSLAGMVPLAGAVGRAIRLQLSLPGAILIGFLVIAVVALIPFVRWLIPLIGVPLGLGSWLGKNP